MHLRFDAASAEVSAPASPQGAAQISLGIDRVVAGNSAGAGWFPGLCILARRDHCMGISRRNRLVAFTGVIGSVCGDTANVLTERDLVQNCGQHWRITDVAAGDPACHLAVASRPSPDQTRSTTTPAAANCHCKLTSSWSCTSWRSNCSCIQLSPWFHTVNPFSRFVQQSPCVIQIL